MSAQEEFDRLYITSSEIMRRLRVTRAAIIHARRKGDLPDAIRVEVNLTIWKRADIEPYVLAWKRRREERIGVA